MADLLVIPSCGSTCTIQEENIKFSDNCPGTGCNVQFVISISTLASPDQTQNIMDRLKTIHSSLDGATTGNFQFATGSWTGK